MHALCLACRSGAASPCSPSSRARAHDVPAATRARRVPPRAGFRAARAPRRQPCGRGRAGGRKSAKGPGGGAGVPADAGEHGHDRADVRLTRAPALGRPARVHAGRLAAETRRPGLLEQRVREGARRLAGVSLVLQTEASASCSRPPSRATPCAARRRVPVGDDFAVGSVSGSGIAVAEEHLLDGLRGVALGIAGARAKSQRRPAAVGTYEALRQIDGSPTRANPLVGHAPAPSSCASMRRLF